MEVSKVYYNEYSGRFVHVRAGVRALPVVAPKGSAELTALEGSESLHLCSLHLANLHYFLLFLLYVLNAVLPLHYLFC